MTRQHSSHHAGAVERLLRQDTVIVLGSVLLIVLAAAWYTVAGVGMNMSAVEMTRMAGPIGEPMTMGSATAWSIGYALLIFLMWWVMMIAMMTPSAAPAVLLFTALKRVGPDKARAATFSLCFLSGYLVAWAAFSLAATALQWGLEHIGLSDGPMMAISSGAFAGIVLLAAGAYQFSELKTACLRHCQSPARFLADHNHPGLLGAFRTGGLHGTYCLGCCWALMLLLFVGGIMNLYWIVGIAAYVALEKLLPTARWLVPVSGLALIGAGVWLIAAPFLTGG
ncbi:MULTISPECIES: DUF2182 domain-containing protein [unclassified Ruegeria]|uniref:DUF2182 domain-containing protein n=1 Tax=unclassified Ruegeria TaxID=2625375 RepID=UPI001492B804|nr:MULTISPECIES: DUF2182 domain-containing protein [unclassified Ruegeria]NOD74638.1 DUF2182 domain-containing protein [Ruegeria sp. HKCCD4332]NOD88628.1 DUF2182 domain-containing protein [Ruegeria sp. HKCCD4318]NOE12144.1 DUF2182 domain-containing protein [Ruegeria sp. HKCCD4318-2]NOG09691.1 DUF2182 domain-containing protein [Ruegeria sp. HKCCD4315]